VHSPTLREGALLVSPGSKSLRENTAHVTITASCTVTGSASTVLWHCGTALRVPGAKGVSPASVCIRGSVSAEQLSNDQAYLHSNVSVKQHCPKGSSEPVPSSAVARCVLPLIGAKQGH
jgi:hypothetical protein